MTNKEYHARPEISASDLKQIASCPAKWIYEKSNPKEPTDAMMIGTAIHTRILEPEKYKDEVAILPTLDRRTKAGKEEYAEFVELSKNKVIITQDQNAEIESIEDSVMSNHYARTLIEYEERIVEKSFFWTDPDTGILCKTRPDLVGIACVDLKSTVDASEDAFMRQAYNLKYHIQAAFYLDGLRANNIDCNRFVFIAVEKTAPYIVQIYVADDSFIERGRIEYKQALRTLAQCRADNKYPGYTNEIKKLTLPKWA